MKSRSDLIIGVDGGGTKTVTWLAPLDDPSNMVVLGRGLAGPGNPRAAGFDVALSNIQAAIDAAFCDARLASATAAAACFGLAGAGREIEQQRIIAWARDKQIAEKIWVTGDAEPILAAASPENCGVALICGTGSLAWGRNAAGDIARCGGWGYVLGDEGSAYAIARAGLVAAVRSLDGRGPKTLLLDRLQRELGAKSSAELIECVYGSQTTRERLAGLAKIVFEMADNDVVAQTIVGAAADDLAEMVAAVSERLKFSDGDYSLALAGSVIAHQPQLRHLVLDRLAKRRCRPKNEAIVDEPVRGTVILARRLMDDPSRTGR